MQEVSLTTHPWLFGLVKVEVWPKEGSEKDAHLKALKIFEYFNKYTKKDLTE